MKPKKHPFLGNILLIIFICLNLANINAGRFDGDAPPETQVVEETETQEEEEPSVEAPFPVAVETEEPTEEPPMDEVVATEQPPSEAIVATEEPSTEEPILTEEIPTDEVNSVENSPIEEANPNEEVAPEEETVIELLSDVPENTDVIVLDENGETVSLVEQEAADIIVEEDPMWCPANVLPGGNGCTTNYPSISALIDELRSSRRANYEQDGIIYFTSGNTNASLSLTRSSLGRTSTLPNW